MTLEAVDTVTGNGRRSMQKDPKQLESRTIRQCEDPLGLPKKDGKLLRISASVLEVLVLQDGEVGELGLKQRV